MNILFYYPSNKRTISIESVMIGFRDQGHTVFLLTQSPKEDLHYELGKNNIETHTYAIKKSNAILYYVRHLLYIVKFCRQRKIDIVYSHLQQANIISVFAQYFCKARFYICRHHSGINGAEKNFNQTLFDQLVNRFAKLIIVPSLKVYKQVVETENVKSQKVKLINYGYDFSKYDKPDFTEVESIRNTYSAKLLLVCVARLVPGKRFMILFEVINELVKLQKLDIKLLVVSDGPLMNDFEKYISEAELNNRIILLGAKSNVIDYLVAADAVPLLSEAEASNNVIKEAGLVNKCVLICKNVGDFDDYIVDGVSGLFLDEKNPAPLLKNYLEILYFNRIDSKVIGQQLHESVLRTFSIEQVIGAYNELNK